MRANIHVKVRRLLITLCVLLPPAGAAHAGEEGERLIYRISYGNVPLAEARISLIERDGRYEVSGEGATAGPLEWLIDWRGSARTVGMTAGEALVPQLHAQKGAWNGKHRQAEVRYGPDSKIEHIVDPPADPAEFTSVPAGSIPGTLDPLTAALSALKRFAATGRCEGTLPIFDGRRRYDMQLEDAGTALLERDRPWNYAGQARGCRLKSRRIGGFFKDSDYASDESETKRLVWLAETAPGTWRPVRIEIDAPIGKIIGRAVLAEN